VQRGNADDALMRRLHGPRWRERAGSGHGRLPWHLATVAAGVVAVTALGAAAATRSRRARWVAVAATALWCGLTGDFARLRIAAGPRDAAEVRRMLVTSVAIPVAAVGHRVLGQWRHRNAGPWPPPVRAVLFDRDGTLVQDVPYNADPELVRPLSGARESLDRLREAGIRVGLVSNQSGVAAGRITGDQLTAVQARVEALLGPFDVVRYCLHAAGDGCGCRKPAPGLVTSACAELGVRPDRCVVVGDIGSDLEAARAAGAAAVLVPNSATRPAETEAADRVAESLQVAVDRVLRGSW
jgi:HAD superfamily hydrolase (TIGR01662 family)